MDGGFGETAGRFHGSLSGQPGLHLFGPDLEPICEPIALRCQQMPALLCEIEDYGISFDHMQQSEETNNASNSTTRFASALHHALVADKNGLSLTNT
jgi:hypothetical protein